jgi:hypothetical protein
MTFSDPRVVAAARWVMAELAARDRTQLGVVCCIGRDETGHRCVLRWPVGAVLRDIVSDERQRADHPQHAAFCRDLVLKVESMRAAVVWHSVDWPEHAAAFCANPNPTIYDLLPSSEWRTAAATPNRRTRP